MAALRLRASKVISKTTPSRGDDKVISMTVSRNLEITCDECNETETWSMAVLRDRTIDSILKNAGFATEHGTITEGAKHYCSDCNDREKDTFYVTDGWGEEYLGEIKAWGIVHARQVAWERFECENMVKRNRAEADPTYSNSANVTNKTEQPAE